MNLRAEHFVAAFCVLNDYNIKKIPKARAHLASHPHFEAWYEFVGGYYETAVNLVSDSHECSSQELANRIIARAYDYNPGVGIKVDLQLQEELHALQHR